MQAADEVKRLWETRLRNNPNIKGAHELVMALGALLPNTMIEQVTVADGVHVVNLFFTGDETLVGYVLAPRRSA